MRLRKIMLSGFKTFVDPTTLTVPGNLVGVVGPNGCGKSNIIDAVTWVMGESSAKHLRGDSITDVIFNGSASRQPVSQATVELVFDNTEGRAGGQYAAYNEISIKRQINREGISSYFLNNSRCRRKDIHGLFLGTGLGPRGYSIIEQGMISRLIEAKPDELRIFIEEAAGISKYRERRRETENRIRHTKENLSRLNDIREELAKQLNHLQRQARAAERYQVLKKEERQLNSELLALDYRDLRAEIQRRQEKVREQETRVEQGVSELRKIEAEIEKKRQELSLANEAFNQVQSDYYQVGGDISQLEQKIQHSHERINALEADINKTRNDIETTENQQRHDTQQLEDLSARVRSLEPELQGSRSETSRAYDTLNQAEQAMQKWQDEWDAYKETAASFSQQLEVGNTRMLHLQESLEEISYRRQLLTEELESLSDEELVDKLAGFDSGLAARSGQIVIARKELEGKLDDVRYCRDKVHALTEKIAELRSRQQKLEGTLASLIALQHGSDDAEQPEMDAWLSSLGQGRVPRLLEQINVEPEWTHAVETVMGRHLQSAVVTDLGSILEALTTLPKGNISVIGSQRQAGENRKKDLPRLIDKIVSPLNLESLLADIYIADDIGAALNIFPDLAHNESVVTLSGIWIGQGWIRVNQDRNTEDSILLREQKIQAIKTENDSLLAEIHGLQQDLGSARAELEKSEEEQHRAQKSLGELQEGLTVVQTEYAEIKARHQQTQKRTEQIHEELESLDNRQQSDQQELERIRQMFARTSSNQTDLEEQKSKLTGEREKHQGLLTRARTDWQSTHEHSHEIALQLESFSSQRASLEQAIKRNDIQLCNLRGSLADLEKVLLQVKEPLAELGNMLDAKLAVRVDTEKKLNAARAHVQSTDTAIREKEQERISAEQKVDECRTLLEKIRLDAQEIKVRLETVREQLQAGNYQPDQILENMEPGADKPSWQQKIEDTGRKIQRLGPINLAAIDEFTQLTERKNYLDLQNKDLSEALDTLANAIHKIDKETRTRFKETFDELNANLKAMFPVLFGGGHAYLEMTGDDLLETGVAIMARPPGKKNSSIHLLSGGEKALTAVALVFAIFKLNPAPFCILDEVDAPLDDTNAGRFSELLAEMSSEVQFIFITHNKITMEIAQQLLGVTMHEPGVSRLVSVDMEEAVQMAVSA